eukprot:scaffold37613_cov67-Phaeocystis_antarctica.AAC.3
MVMALASKENTYKKTGVSATRDVGDEIVCAAMHVLLLCAAFESCRSSVSLAAAFAGFYFILLFICNHHTKRIKAGTWQPDFPTNGYATPSDGIAASAATYQAPSALQQKVVLPRSVDHWSRLPFTFWNTRAVKTLVF